MLLRSHQSQTDAVDHLRFWCGRRLIVTVDGPEGHIEKVIEKPFARIGSHKDSDVVLPYRELPARSLYLHAMDAGVFCVDLSGMDTLEQRVRGWLTPGKAIVFGPCRLSARLDPMEGPADNQRPDLETSGSSGLPNPLLFLSVEGRSLGSIRLTCPLTIVGRNRQSRIRFASRSVSSCHCAMYWDSTTLWVIDLLSLGGTWIDGRSIEVARFLPGSSLKVGQAELTCQIEPAAQPSEEAARQSAPTRSSGSAEIDRLQELAANLASDKEEFESRRAAWQTEQLRLERQLEVRCRDLEAEKAELDAQRQELEAAAAYLQTREVEPVNHEESRQSGQKRKEEGLSQRAVQLENQRQEYAARQEKFEEDRSHWQAELEKQMALVERLRLEFESQLRSLRQQEGEFLRRQEEWLSERREEQKKFAERVANLDCLHAELESRREELLARVLEQQRQQAEFHAERTAIEAQLAEQLAWVQQLRAEMEAERQAFRRQQDQPRPNGKDRADAGRTEGQMRPDLVAAPVPSESHFAASVLSPPVESQTTGQDGAAAAPGGVSELVPEPAEVSRDPVANDSASWSATDETSHERSDERPHQQSAWQSDEEFSEQLFEQTADRLMGLWQSKSRWHRIRQTVLRCVGVRRRPRGS